MLTKRRVVLTFCGIDLEGTFAEDRSAAVFTLYEGDVPEADKSSAIDFFALDVENWRDMGEPKEITVTIESGDLLSEGAE